MPAKSMIRRTFSCCALALLLGLAAASSSALAGQAKKSPAFERFRFSFFEDKDSPRNGLDTAALRQVEGRERREAERMLIRFLPDSRAVIGLGALRSRRAEPQLRRLFQAERRAQRAAARRGDRDWNPYRLAYLAEALWPIRRHPHYIAALTDILGSDRHLHRMQAAISLGVVRHPTAVRALVTALDDPERLVRHHAARMLLAIHGFGEEAENRRNDGEHMLYRVMSDDATRREGGKRDVLDAIEGRTIAAR
jgi:hypothetical protein